MLRIALVTPMLPVPHDQTRGRYIHETARSLGKLATVKTFFQTMQYPRIPGFKPRSFIYGSVGPDYTLDGCDVEAFTFPGVPVVSRGYNGHIASLALTPRVRRFKPDLVLAYWVYPDGFAAMRTARALGVPCIVGALGSDIHVRSGVNEKMTRRTIGGIDALLTVSEAMRQYAIREWGVKPDEKMIVYVGRFVEAKGMRELITAFQQLAKDDPKVTLALVGDGVMKAELMALVASTGLTERVHLPGGQAPEQVAEWINAADVLTLPSWSEGYPNVVVEGVACGRPVVATDVGGTREILHADNGILIPPKNAEALAKALRQALDQPWDRPAIAAAMSRTWDDVAVETLAVCEQVARGARRR